METQNMLYLRAALIACFALCSADTWALSQKSCAEAYEPARRSSGKYWLGEVWPKIGRFGKSDVETALITVADGKPTVTYSDGRPPEYNTPYGVYYNCLVVLRAIELKMDVSEVAARIASNKDPELAALPTIAGIAASKIVREPSTAISSWDTNYEVQEITIFSNPSNKVILQKALADASDIPQFILFLEANGFKYLSRIAVRTADQVPLALARMNEGEAVFEGTASGAKITVLNKVDRAVGQTAERLDQKQSDKTKSNDGVTASNEQSAVAPAAVGPSEAARGQPTYQPPPLQEATMIGTRSNADCNADILRIQADATSRVKATRSRIESLQVQNQYQAIPQRDLFAGPCANHPQASAYIVAANRLTLQYQNAAGSIASGGNAAGNVLEAGLSSDSELKNNGNRRVFVGPVTSNCITYKALNKTDWGAQWFSFTNGCPIKVNVHYADQPSGIFGSMMSLKGGQSDKSWFSTNGPHAVSRVNYIACKEKEGDYDVHLDKQTSQCFYYRK